MEKKTNFESENNGNREKERKDSLMCNHMGL